jgi:hypothetical protein
MIVTNPASAIDPTSRALLTELQLRRRSQMAIVDRAGRALDRLLDNIEAFTRATITEL